MISSGRSIVQIPDFHPKQSFFYESEATKILLGGDTRGGKTSGVKLSLIRWCTLIPGLQCDIFRLHEDDVIGSYMEGDFSFPFLLNQWIKDGLVRVNKTEVRFVFNGSLITLEHCFTADTKIQTTEGIKTIKELIGRQGYVNITESLIGHFLNVRKIQTQAPIVEIKFDDGSVYRCTPDHKFLTTQGSVEAENLINCLCVTNESKLSAKQLKSLMAYNTPYKESISEPEINDCIALFGNTITAQFRKALKSIIRTKIGQITKLKILQLWKSLHIDGFMQAPRKLKKEAKNLLEALKLLQQNALGINPQRVMSGINDKFIRLNYAELIGHANSAAAHLKVLNILDSVGSNAKAQPKDSGIKTKSLKHVWFAIKNFLLSPKLGLKHVVKNADIKFKHKLCVSVKPAGHEDVYCLTVPDYGIFPLSNGVLVFNCSTDTAMSKHQGIPKHVRVFDESGQIPERRMKWLEGWMVLNEEMKARLPPEWRGKFPKVIYLSNPLGPSKAYLRKVFVKARPKFAIEEKGAWKTQYIPYLVEDNPSEDAAITRARVAEIADEATATALLDESKAWDVQTGNYFTPWDSDLHVIKDFLIPDFWLRFRMFDYGSYEPWACLWFAVSPGVTIHKGTAHERYIPRKALVVYREWYGCRAEHPRNEADKNITNLAPEGWSNEDMARGIIERTEERFDTQPTFTDGFPFNNLGGRTIAKEFKDLGVTLTKGDTDRKNRGAQTLSKLNGVKLIAGSEQKFPMLYFFESCKYCQDYMPMVERHPNEARQWDYQEDGEPTHIVDCVTLGCMVNDNVLDAPTNSAEVIARSIKESRNKHPTNNE